MKPKQGSAITHDHHHITFCLL